MCNTVIKSVHGEDKSSKSHIFHIFVCSDNNCYNHIKSSDHIDYTRSRIRRAYDIVAAYVVRYRVRTHVSSVCCSHTATVASASDSSCTSGGLN